MQTLAQQLTRRTRESPLMERLEGNRIRCLACGHRCPIPAGFNGVCKVRFNRAGQLYAPFGYVAGVQCDPIEKKPFFHVNPGTAAFSFGMLGCDLHCGYCQNWVTSQALRDVRSTLEFQSTSARQLAQLAVARGAGVIVSTYNEPLITAEWAIEVFQHARREGLLTGFVSNGNATPEVLAFIKPSVDLYKVDLKSFDEAHYRSLGGRLAPILDSIARIHEMGFWLEVVTLVVPGFNDSESELRSIACFLAGISPNIPWHVTAFHKDYKMTHPDNTPTATLTRAAQWGMEEGLHYVYAGNLPGRTGEWENTRCHGCHSILVRRTGFRVLENRIPASGHCPDCGVTIPGIWSNPPNLRYDGLVRIERLCG
ncbi:MAG: AmmeMemoRadiSam system radical SAM enzyme [Acidimicrobiia bacterium]|nr:AmmeMemoRadiSam system radical SAM enzyme [Acidimicrobiia bacterium]